MHWCLLQLLSLLWFLPLLLLFALYMNRGPLPMKNIVGRYVMCCHRPTNWDEIWWMNQPEFFFSLASMKSSKSCHYLLNLHENWILLIYLLIVSTRKKIHVICWVIIYIIIWICGFFVFVPICCLSCGQTYMCETYLVDILFVSMFLTFCKYWREIYFQELVFSLILKH